MTWTCLRCERQRLHGVVDVPAHHRLCPMRGRDPTEGAVELGDGIRTVLAKTTGERTQAGKRRRVR